jgi:cytoskeletal protein CcmA (bactofilin family)
MGLFTQDLHSLQSLVDEHATLRGRFITSTNLRVDGTIEGDIEAADLPQGPQSSVVVGATGRVLGDIRAYRVLVAGQVDGHIYATEKVILEKGSRIRGDITYESLEVQQPITHQGMLISRVKGVEAVNL